MTAPEGVECVRIIYRGRVQGVGFRFTVSRIATGYPITGYVKNLRDGTVELIAQGTAETIAEFTAEIARVMEGNITGCDRETVTAGEEFSRFSIRR